MIRKSLFLVSFTMLALSVVVQANTCTDAVYKYNSTTAYNPETDIHADSAHSKYPDSEFNEKYIYTNKKIDPIKDNVYNKIVYHYYDTDKSALSNINREILMTKCEAHDSLCIQYIVYDDGIYMETESIKGTSNYTRHEFVRGKGNKLKYSLYEDFLKKDTAITVVKSYTDSSFNNGITREIVYVADSLDDFICYEYEKDDIVVNVAYRTTEEGFSLTFSDDSTFINDVFFVVPKQTNTIRKTIKPVKIAPKARYFDLLGRYKFSK